MAPATSSSTTSSRPVGRPPGTRRQFKAERRLTRELAANQVKLELLNLAKSASVEFLRTAKSNPVIGLFSGIAAVDIGVRTGVLGPNLGVAFFGFLGAKAATDIIGSFAGILPFSQAGAEKDAFQPTLTSETNTEIKTEKGVVAKEFL